MVGIAAHEYEPVVDPVGHSEAEHALVEVSGLLRIVDHPGDMAELERADAVMRERTAEIAPFLEKRDAGTFVVPESQDGAETRDRIVSQLAANALLFQFARSRAEVAIGRN